MCTIRTRFLIDKRATKGSFKNLSSARFRVVRGGVVLSGGCFKVFVQLVGDVGVELEGVLLFTNVDLCKYVFDSYILEFRISFGSHFSVC